MVELYEFLFNSNFYIKILSIILASLLVAISGNILVEKTILKLVLKTKSTLDNKIMEEIRGVLIVTVFFLVMYNGLQWSNIGTPHLGVLKDIGTTITTIYWTASLIRVSDTIVKQATRKDLQFLHLNQATNTKDILPFFGLLSKVTLIIGALLIILNLWGIDIRPALASAGILGVALAFAAQDTIANLFGGVSVFMDKPYKTGDFIITKDSYRGKVIAVGLRSTKIKTQDNILLSIPNSVMVTDAVVNETGLDPKLRIRVPVTVGYESNLQFVEDLLLKILDNNEHILDEPGPSIQFTEFGDNGIHVVAMGMIKNPEEKFGVIHTLIKDIHKGLKENGIEIPFPKRDITIKNS
ncbi:MAG: mechanosensitive ion channel family protein [Patescibacteria group bacterium]|uniref:Mechanosensitive ion channel family protein n=1 Tax=candidate division WWE3 bacterium TaxID=2053526 RepID=A0A955J1H8_UNCKA|nr:mechanosensitive ion channel family protein [candidate division WWE3 bacterium]